MFVEALKKAGCEKENEQDIGIPSAMTSQADVFRCARPGPTHSSKFQKTQH